MLTFIVTEGARASLPTGAVNCEQGRRDRKTSVPCRRARRLQPSNRRLGDERPMRTELVLDALQMA